MLHGQLLVLALQRFLRLVLISQHVEDVALRTPRANTVRAALAVTLHFRVVRAHRRLDEYARVASSRAGHTNGFQTNRRNAINRFVRPAQIPIFISDCTCVKTVPKTPLIDIDLGGFVLLTGLARKNVVRGSDFLSNYASNFASLPARHRIV